MAGWREAGAYDAILGKAGYRRHGAGVQERTNEVAALGLTEGGDYRVLGAYSAGEVRVLVEQNESPMVGAPAPFAGVPVIHDPVAVVSGPLGSVAVDLADPDAAQVLARAREAVTDPDYQKDAV